MKKIILASTLFLLVLFLLTGCRVTVEYTYEHERKTEELLLEADFTITERGSDIILDASSTEIKGYRNPQFSWKVGDRFFEGERIRVSAPLESTRIRLTVVADHRRETVTDRVEKSYTPTIVRFEYERIGFRRYEFVGSMPRNARYWIWSFPHEGFIPPDEGNNRIVYRFSSSGDKRVGLEVYDRNWNKIGSEFKTIRVY